MAKNHCEDCIKSCEDCCNSFYSRFATIGDARRIATFLGKKPRNFLKYAELSENDRKTYLYSKKPHGYYYDLASNGKILQLRTKRDGACFFFAKGSCTIYPSRPIICRMFPFWFSGRKIIVDNNGLDCPVVCGKKALVKSLSRSEIKAGLKKIGYDEKGMKRLLSQLRNEIDEYKKDISTFVRENRL